MKFLVSILITMLLAFAGSLFFDWWIIAVAAWVVAVCIPQSPGRSFASGFTALFFLWGGLALLADIPNQHILSQKIATILPLQGNYMYLILLTANIGALVGGMAALTGSFLHRKKLTSTKDSNAQPA